MWIHEFTDYKVFLKALMRTLPKSGRGQARKLAMHLNVAPMVVSHILSRDQHFTGEQALKVAAYFGFDDSSSEYFVYLVNFARANSKELRSFYEKRLLKLREESQNIKNLVAGRDELSKEDKGIFYSNWYYLAIWLLSSIEGYQSVEAIADYFDLNKKKVGEAVSFLVSTGLCTQTDGKIRMAVKSIHVDDASEFVNNHRRNWREKARESFSDLGKGNYFYSSPVSLSEKDAEEFRKTLLSLIKSFSEKVVHSPEEKLMCLNIDWFEF